MVVARTALHQIKFHKGLTLHAGQCLVDFLQQVEYLQAFLLELAAGTHAA